MSLCNISAPSISPKIQRELTRIAGLVPSGNGRFSGQPVLKIVWGQSEKAFDAGKQRIRFYNQDIQPIFKRTAYAISKEGFAMLAEKLRQKNDALAKYVDAKMLADTWKDENYGFYHTLLFLKHKYLLDKYVSTLDWKEIPAGLSVEQTALHIPADWFYLEEIPDVTEIGSPNWFVVQWLSAADIDTRDNWEARRWNYQHVIEFGDTKQWVDSIGEYPAHGEYWNALLKVETKDGDYAEPGQRNCVSIIEEMWHAKKHRPERMTAVVNRIANRLQAAAERQKVKDVADKATFMNTFWSEGRVIVKGKTAKVFPREKYEIRKTKKIATIKG
jgi:hypothetical protein